MNKNVILGCVSGILVVVFLMFAIPTWNVWQAGMSGEAARKKAAQTRMIQIEQAKGEKEAAVLRADAIKIVGQAAKDFPEYRTQEFIGAFGEALKSDKIEKIIYVATEAGIPITESNRLHKDK